MDRGLRNFRERAVSGEGGRVEVVPLFKTEDDVIVEWRAATVGFLDELLVDVNASLGLSGAERLSLAQMLEAGSWKVSFSSFSYPCPLFSIVEGDEKEYEREHELIR